MSKSDIKALSFIGVILIAFGFALGYFTAWSNVEPQTIETEVVKVEYVDSAADTGKS